MRLEQRRRCLVTLAQPATSVGLAKFLSRPQRPLHGLLRAERLQTVGPGLFEYQSRPYGVAAWTLQPRVLLRVSWDGRQLWIEQLEARVEGLGDWQEHLRFGLEAWLRPAPGATLQAEALVWVELPAAAAAVATPALHLGLQQLLDRLERRCHHGLRRRAEDWLRRRQPQNGADA